MIVELMKQERGIVELRRELLRNEEYSLQGVMTALAREKEGEGNDRDEGGEEGGEEGDEEGEVCQEDLVRFLTDLGGDEVSNRQVEKLLEVMNCCDRRVRIEQLRWLVEGF